MSNDMESRFFDGQNGKEYADAKEMLNDYIARFSQAVSKAIGEEITFEPLDADGYSSVKRGSATVGINVLEDQGILLLLSRIMPIPVNQEKEFYRKLLELNYLATSDGAFAIEKDSNTVYLRALRRLSGLDYEEFEDLLNTTATVADNWDDVLIKSFG